MLSVRILAQIAPCHDEVPDGHVHCKRILPWVINHSINAYCLLRFVFPDAVNHYLVLILQQQVVARIVLENSLEIEHYQGYILGLGIDPKNVAFPHIGFTIQSSCRNDQISYPHVLLQGIGLWLSYLALDSGVWLVGKQPLVEDIDFVIGFQPEVALVVPRNNCPTHVKRDQLGMHVRFHISFDQPVAKISIAFEFCFIPDHV